MSDVVERLRELLAKATPGPWLYRPQEYDDWGTVRGGVATDWGLPHLGQMRSATERGNEIEAAHREAGTDPWEWEARLVAEAITALPDLLAEITRLRAELASAVAAERERCAPQWDDRHGGWS